MAIILLMKDVTHILLISGPSVGARNTYERMAGIDLQNGYREGVFINIRR